MDMAVVSTELHDMTNKQIKQRLKMATKNHDNKFAAILNAEMQFREDRKQAIKAAKELQYGKEVIQKLERASNLYEVNRIMIAARHAM